jgi:hypothetical protein
MIRTPHDVKNEELEKISPFKKQYVDGVLRTIEISRSGSSSSVAFRYLKSQVEEIGKVVFKKPSLTDEELYLTELVFIHASIRWQDELNLLVTNNQKLLENRLWFEGHFPGGELNIMTLEEAAEIVDLYVKIRGLYSLSPNYSTNKGYWYWLSFRTKVPFYNVGDPILDALSQRFVFCLMSVDEMGFQFYSGVNNDTMDSTIYHFNYYISLVSGIFDNLAIRTFNQYTLAFKDSSNPSRISLQNELGKEFLKALREKNAALRQHIQDHAHLVKAIYILRDTILHREGLEHSSFENRGENGPWKANFIKVPVEIVDCLKQCRDKKENFEPWTKFGIYQFNEIFLEPFKFSKTSILLLAAFVNKYLEILGFRNFVETLKIKDPKDDFVKTIETFKEDNLGL